LALPRFIRRIGPAPAVARNVAAQPAGTKRSAWRPLLATPKPRSTDEIVAVGVP